jgi:hypothetical protein
MQGLAGEVCKRQKTKPAKKAAPVHYLPD